VKNDAVVLQYLAAACAVGIQLAVGAPIGGLCSHSLFLSFSPFSDFSNSFIITLNLTMHSLKTKMKMCSGILFSIEVTATYYLVENLWRTFVVVGISQLIVRVLGISVSLLLSISHHNVDKKKPDQMNSLTFSLYVLFVVVSILVSYTHWDFEVAIFAKVSWTLGDYDWPEILVFVVIGIIAGVFGKKETILFQIKEKENKI
jgi:hypothetical protein